MVLQLGVLNPEPVPRIFRNSTVFIIQIGGTWAWEGGSEEFVASSLTPVWGGGCEAVKKQQ